jgi:hypothetical protein
MYVADPFRPSAVGSLAPSSPPVPAPQPVAGPEPVVVAHPSSWTAPEWRAPDARRPAARVRTDGLSAATGRLVAGAFSLAWILCPTVEPLPSGPTPDYPLWQLPIDLATVASILVAVVALWRGGRLGALLGAVAGTFMLLETAMCPIAGHTTVGWWTWTQTLLSLFVLGTSAALLARQSPAA